MVGITERFDQSLELFADLLGVPAPAAAPAVNVGPKKAGLAVRGYRSTLPPAVIEQVEALTVYDRELYAHALELFEQQYARYKAHPRRMYSIMPRLRVQAYHFAYAAWQRVKRAFPALAGSAPLRNIARRVARLGERAQ